jgi:hypothetical protein
MPSLPTNDLTSEQSTETTREFARDEREAPPADRQPKGAGAYQDGYVAIARELSQLGAGDQELGRAFNVSKRRWRTGELRIPSLQRRAAPGPSRSYRLCTGAPSAMRSSNGRPRCRSTEWSFWRKSATFRPTPVRPPGGYNIVHRRRLNLSHRSQPHIARSWAPPFDPRIRIGNSASWL